MKISLSKLLSAAAIVLVLIPSTVVGGANLYSNYNIAVENRDIALNT